MPKHFRFLVTLPAANAPSPVAGDVREEIAYLLGCHINGVKVVTLRRDERVIPATMLDPLPIRRNVKRRL